MLVYRMGKYYIVTVFLTDHKPSNRINKITHEIIANTPERGKNELNWEFKQVCRIRFM